MKCSDILTNQMLNFKIFKIPRYINTVYFFMEDKYLNI